MSHQILERDSQFGIEMGWHKLTKVRPVLQRDECFPDFHLIPLTYQSGGETRPLVTPCPGGVKEWAAVVADDDNLSSEPVPSSYTLFTPREAWDKLEQILAGTRYRFSSALTMQNRTRWSISVELDELGEVMAGMTDAHKVSLNFWGGLNRSLSPVCNLSATRIVCANTLAVNANDEESFLFSGRLTKNFNSELDSALPEIEKAVGMARIFRVTYEKMATTKATTDEAREVYAGFLTSEVVGGSLAKSKGRGGSERSSKTANRIETLVEAFRGGIGNQGKTRADILNGFTEIYTRGEPGSKKDVLALVEAGSDGGRYGTFKSEFFNVLTTPTRYGQTRLAGRKALQEASSASFLVAN